MNANGELTVAVDMPVELAKPDIRSKRTETRAPVAKSSACKAYPCFEDDVGRAVSMGVGGFCVRVDAYAGD